MHTQKNQTLREVRETSHSSQPLLQTPADFFNAFSLPESKIQLFLWLRLTVTGRYSKLNSCEKEELWVFYEHMQALLEVSVPEKVK